MAGIRGAKNPFPKQTTTLTGLFKQRDSGGPFSHADVKSAAYKSDRVGPKARNNKLATGPKGPSSNPDLKRGTSERS